MNVVPLGALKIWGPGDLAIPKLLRIAGTDALLTFGRLLRSEWGNFWFSQDIADAGLEVVENDTEGTRGLVKEMIDVLDERKAYSLEEEALQDRTQELFVPRNYSYHSRTRIGTKFLQKYENLGRV